MFDLAQSVTKWIQRRWSEATTLLRLLYLTILAAVVATLVALTPFALNFRSWFSQARPEAQAFVLLFILILGMAFLLSAWDRSRRVEELKDDNAQLKVRLASAEEDVRRIQERWDHLLAVGSRDVLWKRPCQIVAPPFIPKGQRDTRFLTILNLGATAFSTTRNPLSTRKNAGIS